MLVMSLTYTPVILSTVCMLFLMCLATIHQQTTVDKQFGVYDSDKPVALSKTKYRLLDPEHGYNYAKFEIPPLNCVRQKAIV